MSFSVQCQKNFIELCSIHSPIKTQARDTRLSRRSLTSLLGVTHAPPPPPPTLPAPRVHPTPYPGLRRGISSGGTYRSSPPLQARNPPAIRAATSHCRALLLLVPKRKTQHPRTPRWHHLGARQPTSASPLEMLPPPRSSPGATSPHCCHLPGPPAPAVSGARLTTLQASCHGCDTVPTMQPPAFPLHSSDASGKPHRQPETVRGSKGDTNEKVNLAKDSTVQDKSKQQNRALQENVNYNTHTPPPKKRHENVHH